VHPSHAGQRIGRSLIDLLGTIQHLEAVGVDLYLDQQAIDTTLRLQIEEGALYTALHRMEKRGWLESEWGLSENNRRAKYYQLTSQGRKQLRAKTVVWTDYAAAVFKVLQTA
jgi:DNA-binding PadR family transcriptional regulator